MQDLWLAFMRDPVNGLPNQGWTPYVPGEAGYSLQFAWNGTVTSRIPLQRFDANCMGNTAKPGAIPPNHVGLDGVVDH